MSQSNLAITAEEQPLISLSQINTFVFCNRRFYYESVEGHQVVNHHVEEGKIKHLRVHTQMKDRSEKGKSISRQQYFASPQLGVSGYVDLIEFDGEGQPTPVEYKKAGSGNWLNDQVQLCLQGMLIEESESTASGSEVEVAFGYIYYIGSNRRRKVPFDEQLRQQSLDFVRQAQELMSQQKIPQPVHDNRCNGCSLREICLPGEVAYLKDQDQRPLRIQPALGIDQVLYVDEPGVMLKKTGQRLLMVKEGQTLQDIPLIHIGQVVVGNGVSLTTPVFQTLLKEGIPVGFLSSYGRYQGGLTPAVSRNSLLRMSQFQAAQKPDQCLAIAKSIVTGKIHNMRVMLQRRKWKAEETKPEIARQVQQIGKIKKKVSQAESLAQLLGLEGNASAHYFATFDTLLKTETGFRFQKRSRRPPKDPVNALLSFAYSLLTLDLSSAIQLVGLDPYIGFYHQQTYGRPCLALDLMEEFRSVIADSVVITLINNRQILVDDFELKSGGFYLKSSARKVFYAAYEKRKNDQITHPTFGYQLPLRRLIELQVRILAKYLQGEIDTYSPLTIGK
jgi:CRISPR-associated protein Cas1